MYSQYGFRLRYEVLMLFFCVLGSHVLLVLFLGASAARNCSLLKLLPRIFEPILKFLYWLCVSEKRVV